MAKRKRKTILRVVWSAVGLLGLIVIVMGAILYRYFLTPNLNTSNLASPYLCIPTGSNFEGVVKLLRDKNLLIDEKSFRWSAERMNYIQAVKPGRYRLTRKMNNKELITLLRSGKQSPVNVIFNNIRTREQLSSRISEQIEAPASSILNLMNDPDYTRSIGFTSDNILGLFLPDTYEFYWNTSADQFIKRMKREYEKFWTPERIRKAGLAGLNPIQVSVLASIVQQESNRNDEKPVIAGVYLNRLRKGWKLEADPTLVYALGDFSISRVLSVYKAIDSRYNTYMYAGLPPGPICLPTQASLNAVLNFSHHNYMYFCAKDDFSGYHAFAASYEQHLANARRFQKALDKRGIRS